MSQESLRVLLLDDERSLRLPLKDFLQRQFNYQVDEAEDGFAALDLATAAQGRYDVALIDQYLVSGPHGIEVMGLLKSRYPDIECIIFTGWGRAERERALAAGAFRYLEKPFDNEELALLIRTAAQQVRLRTISRDILAERDLDQLLDGIRQAARSLALADDAAIVLTDRTLRQLKHHANPYPPEQRFRRHLSNLDLTLHIINNCEIYSCPDISKLREVDNQFLGSGWTSFIGLPIPGDEEGGSLGVLYVYSRQKGHFDAWGTVSVLQTLASQAGLAIANAQTFQQIQLHAAYMEALVRAGQGFTQARRVEDQLILAGDFLRQQFGISIFLIALYDTQRSLLSFPLSYEGETRVPIEDRWLGQDPHQEGVSGYVILTGEELSWQTVEEGGQRCSELGIEPMHMGSPQKPETCFYLPLKSGAEILGMISIQSYQARAFSPIVLDACRALGSQLSVALENARLFQAESSRRQEAETLREAALSLATQLDQENIFESILVELQRVVPYDSASVQLLRGNTLEIIGGRGFSNLPELVGIELSINDDCPNRQVIIQRAPYSVDDVTPLYPKFSEEPHLQAGIRSWLGAPMIVGEQLIGMIALDKREQGFYHEEHARLAQSFAAQAALAIENARLYQETQQRAARLEALQNLTLNLNASLDQASTLQSVCQAAVTFFNVDHSGLVLFNEKLACGEVQAEYPSLGAVGQKIPITGVPAEQRLIKTREPLLIPDVPEAMDELGPVGPILLSYNIHAILIFPVISKEGLILGSFSLDHLGEARPFQSEEVELGKVFAAHVAVALENARLYQATKEGQAYLQSIYEASNAFLSPTEPNQVLQAVVDNARRTTGAWRAVVVLLDKEMQPHLLVQSGYDRLLEASNDIRPSGVTMQVIRSRKPRIYPSFADVAEEEINPKMIADGTQAAACLPLVRGEIATGALWLQFTQPHPFSAIQRQALLLYANQAAVAYDHARLYAEATHRSQLLEALEEVSRHIRAVKQPDKLVHEIVRLAAQLVNCQSGCLCVNRPHLGELEVDTLYNLPEDWRGQRIPHANGLVSLAARYGKMQVRYHLAQSEDEAPFTQSGLQSAVAIPLKHGGAVEAVLLLGQRDADHKFNIMDLEILGRLAAQAEIALQTSRLMTREQRMAGQLRVLHQIGEYLQESDDLDEILHVTLTGVTAGYGLGFNRAAVFLLTEQRDCMVGRTGIGHLVEAEAREAWEKHVEAGLEDLHAYLKRLKQTRFEPTPIANAVEGLTLAVDSAENSLFREVILSGKCQLALKKDLDRLPAAFRAAFQPALPMVVAPLLARNQVIGVLIADNKFTRTPITAEDEEALMSFANTAAATIANTRLFNENKIGRERLTAFYEASNALVSSQDLEQVLKEIVERACQAAAADGVSMVLIDNNGRVQRMITVGIDKPADPSDLIRENGISRQVMRTRVSYPIENTTAMRQVINPSLLWRKIGAALCLPVILEGSPIGVMWFHYQQPRRFPSPEVEAVQLFVNQAALAYDSARRLREVSLVRDGARNIAHAATLGDVRTTLNAIVRMVKELLNCDTVTLYTYNDRTMQVEEVFAAGSLHYEDLRQPGEIGLESTVWSILDLPDPYFAYTSDSPHHPIFSGGFEEKEGVQATLGIQLRVEAARVGVLFINYRTSHRFGQDELDNALLYAHLAAIAIHDAQLYEEIHRRANALQALYDAGRVITGTLTLQETLEHIAQQALALVGGKDEEGCFSLLALKQGNALEFTAASNPDIQQRLIAEVGYIDLVKDANIGISGRAALTGKSQLVGNVNEDGDYRLFEPRTNSEMAVPIKIEDQVTGVINVEHPKAHAFDQEALQAMENLAAQAAIAIRNARQYEELVKTQNQVAASTAMAYTGMISSIWSHSVEKHALTIRERIPLLRSKLAEASRVEPRIQEDLDAIERMAMKILERPITPPLGLEEAVRSIKLNEFILERTNQLWRNEPIHGVALHLNLQLEDRATVRAAPEWLRQVLDLIIDNAVEAMGKKAVDAMEITISTRRRGIQAEICVRDNGPGFRAEVLGWVFKEPIPKEEGEKGLGLGLLMVKMIVSAYGGEVTVAENSADGAALAVTLPLAKTGASTPLPESERKYSFLLVSTRKESTFRGTISQALAPLGKLEVILPGERPSGRPDVIIVDAAGQDEEVISRVEQMRDEFPGAEIIVAAASQTWRRARAALQAGAVEYIQKSMAEKELYQFFKTLVQEKIG